MVNLAEKKALDEAVEFEILEGQNEFFLDRFRESSQKHEMCSWEYYCHVKKLSSDEKEDLKAKLLTKHGFYERQQVDVKGATVTLPGTPSDQVDTMASKGRVKLEEDVDLEDRVGSQVGESFVVEEADPETMLELSGKPRAEISQENGSFMISTSDPETLMQIAGQPQDSGDSDEVSYSIMTDPSGKKELVTMDKVKTIIQKARQEGKEKDFSFETKTYNFTEVLKRKSSAFSENYEVLEELARGGMGKVVRALEKAVGREVAMKVALVKEKSVLDRFKFEARITGQIEHPNIVKVYDVGLDNNGDPYYTMTFIKGKSLTDRIEKQKDRGRLLEKKYLQSNLEIFTDVCKAIAYAHSHGVINRDLKPDNVMVGDEDEVLVVDWGLAKRLGHKDRMGGQLKQRREQMIAEDEAVNKTLDGTTMGTPHYMPPEQADGEIEKIDARSDVYSLGGILYEILTGEKPIEEKKGQNVWNIIDKVLGGKIIPPHERMVGVPRELSDVVMKAMSLEKKDRYQTADELLDDVKRYIRHEEVSAHKYGLITKGMRLMQRHTVGTVGVMALLGIVTVGSILGAFYFSAKAGEADALEDKLVAVEGEKKALEARDGINQAKIARADANKLFRMAGQYQIKKDFQTAYNCYMQSIKTDLSHAGAWNAAGYMQYELDNYKEAIRLFDVAIGLWQDFKDNQKKNKNENREQRTTEESLELIEGVAHKNKADSLFMLGLRLKGKKKPYEHLFNEAEQLYDLVIDELNPNLINAFNRRAIYHFRRADDFTGEEKQKRLTMALADMGIYIEKAPDDASGYSMMGYMETKIGPEHYGSAEAHLKTAIDGGDREALYRIGLLYYKWERFDEAGDYLRISQKVNSGYKKKTVEVILQRIGKK